MLGESWFNGREVGKKRDVQKKEKKDEGRTRMFHGARWTLKYGGTEHCLSIYRTLPARNTLDSCLR